MSARRRVLSAMPRAYFRHVEPRDVTPQPEDDVQAVTREMEQQASGIASESHHPRATGGDGHDCLLMNCASYRPLPGAGDWYE